MALSWAAPGAGTPTTRLSPALFNGVSYSTDVNGTKLEGKSRQGAWANASTANRSRKNAKRVGIFWERIRITRGEE
jgi:hypothetical protein